MQNGIWGEFFGDMTYDMGFYQQLAFFFTNEIYLKNDVNGIGDLCKENRGYPKIGTFQNWQWFMIKAYKASYVRGTLFSDEPILWIETGPRAGI